MHKRKLLIIFLGIIIFLPVLCVFVYQNIQDKSFPIKNGQKETQLFYGSEAEYFNTIKGYAEKAGTVAQWWVYYDTQFQRIQTFHPRYFDKGELKYLPQLMTERYPQLTYLGNKVKMMSLYKEHSGNEYFQLDIEGKIFLLRYYFTCESGIPQYRIVTAFRLFELEDGRILKLRIEVRHNEQINSHFYFYHDLVNQKSGRFVTEDSLTSGIEEVAENMILYFLAN